MPVIEDTVCAVFRRDIHGLSLTSALQSGAIYSVFVTFLDRPRTSQGCPPSPTTPGRPIKRSEGKDSAQALL